MSTKLQKPIEEMNPIPSDRTHGGVTRKGIIDFSASINPLGPPPGAFEAYHSAAAAIMAYPPAYPEKLNARLAEWLGVDPDRVMAGNGSTHLLHLLARTLPISNPHVVIPTFSEIANAFIVGGQTPYPIGMQRQNGFALELAQVRRALHHRADALFIGRPNSPTGSMISLAQAAEIIAECQQFHALCVFDEAFIDFTDGAESVIELLRTLPAHGCGGLIVIRSLTKIFAIPGLRIGFLAAAPEIIVRLRRHFEPWSVNVVAERVAIACLDGADEFVRRTGAVVAMERARLFENLSSFARLHVFPSAANFLMLEVEEDARGETFGDFMLRKKFAVRDLRTLPGCAPGLYRIAVRMRTDNDCLIAAAREYLGT
jgi:threonine-phosphate decarboxylase